MHWIELNLSKNKVLAYIADNYFYIKNRSMFRVFTFKKVDGSCLIDCALNSILNSHEIIVKLYELTSESKSLNNDFIEL